MDIFLINKDMDYIMYYPNFHSHKYFNYHLNLNLNNHYQYFVHNHNFMKEDICFSNCFNYHQKEGYLYFI